jgi:hypothetical protein
MKEQVPNLIHIGEIGARPNTRLTSLGVSIFGEMKTYMAKY